MAGTNAANGPAKRSQASSASNEIAVATGTSAQIADADIEPAPAFGARIKTDFIRGMGKVNGRFVILLDVEQVLGTDNLALAARAGEMAGADSTQ